MSYGTSSYGTTEYAGRLAGAGSAPTPTPIPTFSVPVEVRGTVLERQPDPTVPFETRGVHAMPSAVVSCASFIKDPAATKDYWIDWSEILEAGETIATSAWDGGGLTTSGAYVVGDVAYVFLAGGVVDTVYVVGNTITTSLGRTYRREIRIICERT